MANRDLGVGSRSSNGAARLAGPASPPLKPAHPIEVPPPPPRAGARLLIGPLAIVMVLLSAEQRLPAARLAPEPVFYRYRSGGSVVFVDDLSRVPLKYRRRAEKVDLSRVSLNTEVARGLQAETERELARLREAEARRAAGVEPAVCAEDGAGAWLGRLWTEHGHLVLIAGVLLGLAIATPYVVRHATGDRWARLMVFLVPLLVSMAVITVAATRTSRVARKLRGQIACGPPGAAGPAVPVEPSSLPALGPGLRKLDTRLQSVERELPREKQRRNSWITNQDSTGWQLAPTEKPAR